MKILLIYITFNILHLLISAPYHVHAAGTNKIEGSVVLNTKDGNTPVGGAVVILNSHGKAASGVLSTTADNYGIFIFEGLSSEADVSYYATTVYEDVTYGSDIIKFENNDSVKNIQFTVYHSTMDKNLIHISSHVITVDVNTDERKFILKESITLKNNSDKIYAGSRLLVHNKKEAVRLTLPDKFQDLEYVRGLNVNSSFVNDRGILDTTPILPGERMIEFIYKLPFNPPDHELLWLTYFDTAKFILLFKNVGAKIESNILSLQGVDEIKKKKGSSDSVNMPGYYLNMGEKDIKSGTTIGVRINGLQAERFDLRIIAGFVFAVLILIGQRLSIRGRISGKAGKTYL